MLPAIPDIFRLISVNILHTLVKTACASYAPDFFADFERRRRRRVSSGVAVARVVAAVEAVAAVAAVAGEVDVHGSEELICYNVACLRVDRC